MVPDYYARLGVDQRAERAEIEAALKRMQPAWSMGTRNPKTRHANQLFLDEIPALRKALLGDPASRAAYDAELAMVQVAERDQKLDVLLRRVNLRAAKGGLTATDRRLLTDEATKLGLSEEDLLRLTRPIPNLVETAMVDDEPRTRRRSARSMSSTPRPAARFVERSITLAVAISMMRSESVEMRRFPTSLPAPMPNASAG